MVQRISAPTRKYGLGDWGWIFSADRAKEAVALWASSVGFAALTEVEGIVDGRLDVLLVPLNVPARVTRPKDAARYSEDYWESRWGLAAVEIKLYKQDFRRGLDEQFARYARSIAGLYIAGPPTVVRPSLVPKEYGVLSIGERRAKGLTAVCRRHPSWIKSEPTAGQMWRVMWALERDFSRRSAELAAEKRRFIERFKETAGEVLTAAISKAVEGRERREPEGP